MVDVYTLIGGVKYGLNTTDEVTFIDKSEGRRLNLFI